jgi:hypothetical protein
MGLQISADPTAAINLTSGGSGYTSAPKVTIVADPLDTAAGGATATATVAGGVVTGITVTQAGAGYTRAPTVVFSGGGGTGAAAEVSATRGFEVVNLRFDGGAPVSMPGFTPPSAPSFGVGYAPGALPTVLFNPVGLVDASAVVGGVQNLAGNVNLLPSQINQTLSLGDGFATPFVDSSTLGAITAAGSISVGTITVGNRTTDDVTVDGLVLSTDANLALVSGGNLTDVGLNGASTQAGLLTLSAAGDLGAAGNDFNISGGRVAVVTEGDRLALDSSTTLIQLHVQTDGTVGSQSIADGGNLFYDVTEGNGITLFGAPGGGGNSVSITAGSLDFRYVNTAGDIDVFENILNVQAAVAGFPAGGPRSLEIRAPNGILTLDNGVFINSGGGDITLASQDLFILGAGSETRPADGLPNNDFLSDTADPTVLWTFGGINTFRSTGGVGASFGTRAGMNVTTLYAGQISGEGGVLTLEPTSPSAQGRTVFLTTTDKDNAYNLGRYETMLLEAPAIRIGGSQTADIRIEPIDTRAPFQRVNLTYNRGTPNTTTDTVTYRPRFFENPFFDYGPTVPPAPDNVGPDQNSSARPHVFGGSVSFVSALGEVRNLPDGDINVNSFSMTGVDGAFFDGRGGVNADYAGAGAGAGFNIGSLIGQISGRTGRTILDETIGSGGDYSFFIGAAIGVIDGRDVNATSITGTQTTVLTSTAPVSPTVTVTGGEVTEVTAAASGSGYTSSPVVTFYGGGIQEASARALLDEAAFNSGGTSGVARVVPQVIGEGYTSIPEVVISGGGGTGATAVAFINGSGQLSPFEVVTTGVQYDFAPTVQIFGDGTGAVARPILSNGTSGTLVGLQIVDPGSGYSTVDAVVLSGGGRAASSQATVRLASGYQPANRGGQITPIYVSSAGTGYTSEPTVTLNGGGIRQAQATALVDTNPGSATRGQVVGYQITDPGQGYRSAPSVSIGRGEAFGNFGEYGVSTEQVDRDRASGNIVLNTVGTVNNLQGSLELLAPVQTGNAFGVGGSGARSGSILLDVGYQLTANTDGGQDGVLITGDASVVGSVGANESARSGSITITAYSMENSDTSSLALRTGSVGLPVQIGTANGAGGVNVVGTLNARVTDRVADEFGAGDLQVYAPAPGELETAAGGVAGPPIDPNHRQRPPRSSNDLFLSGLQSDATFTDSVGNALPDESLVTVEVGAFEGKLTLLRYAPASATATVVNGQVTLITPEEGGPLFTVAPTVVITGAGVVQAEGLATIANGQLGSVEVTDPGAGYGVAPVVTITGGGGTGATAVAVVENGRVTGISVTNPGFGYTSLPTITVGVPSGRPATATATTGRVQLGGGFFTFGAITSVTITDPGSGYKVAPPVTVTDTATAPGTVLGRNAQLVAVLNDSEGIGSITIVNPGIFYVQPQVTIGNPTGPAAATANLVNNQVESYTITNAGAGYNGAPSIFLTTNPDPYNLDIDKLGLFADRVSILKDAPASLVITASVAAVGPYTNQRPVDLVATVNDLVTGSLSLTRPDLQRFQVDTLIAGRRQDGQPQVGAGVITISTPVDASNLRVKDGIVLAGTRQILDEGGTTGISVKNLTLDAGGQILLTGTGNQIQYLAATIRDSGLAENASFTLFNQLRTVGSALVPLTIGEIFVDGAFATGQRFYQGITTQDGDLRVFTDQLQQTSEVGFLDTSGGDPERVLTSQVTLAPYTAGRGINLYATTPSSSSVLGLRVGNSQAPGLELVSSKGLVIGSGSLRDIEVTSGGFGYTTAPAVTITGGGGSGAEAVAILDSEGIVVDNIRYYQVRSVRITNPGTGYSTAPTIEFGTPVFGSGTATASATVGAAGAITLNSNLEFNYGQYPQAPYQVSLVSGSTGSITAGSNQRIPTQISRVRVGSLTLIDAGTVSLGGANDVDRLSAVLTGSGSAANLSFADIDAIDLGRLQIPGNLTVVAGGRIRQVSGEIGDVAGTVSLINTGGGIAFENGRALSLGTILAGNGGSLSLTAAGDITQVANTAVSAGNATITAQGGAILLVNESNDFTGTVNLRNSSASAISVRDFNDLTIGTIEMATFDPIPVATDWGDALATIDTTAGSATFGQVIGLALTNPGGGTPGTGYLSTPTVSINGGGGSGATGTVTVDLDPTSPFYGQVTGITLTSGGSGYRFTPAVTLGTAVSLEAGGDLSFTAAGGYDLPGALQASAGLDVLNTIAISDNVILTTGAGFSSFTTGGEFQIGDGATLQTGGVVRVTSNLVDLGNQVPAVSAVQGIEFLPQSGSFSQMSIDDLPPLPGTYGLTTGQLLSLSVPNGYVQLGREVVINPVTGIETPFTLNIGLSGPVDLSVVNYSLMLKAGAGMTFFDTLTLPAGTSLDLGSVGGVIQGTGFLAGRPDLVINGGNLSFSYIAGVGEELAPFKTEVEAFGTSFFAGSAYLDNSDYLAGDTLVNGTDFVVTEGGSLRLDTGAGLNMTARVSVEGTSSFNLGALGADFTAGNAENDFIGKVTITGNLNDVTIFNQTRSRVLGGVTIPGEGLYLGDLTAQGAVTIQVTSAASDSVGKFTFDSITAGGNVTITSQGVEGGPLDMATLGGGGVVAIEAGARDVILDNSGNQFNIAALPDYGLTITDAGDVRVYIRSAQEEALGPVAASGIFQIQTDAGFVLPSSAPSGEFDLTDAQLSNLTVGTLSLSGTGDILIPSLYSYPNIRNLDLITSGGDILADGVVRTGNLSLDASGAATFNAVNSIQSLGPVRTGGGNFTLANGQGMNLTGTVSVAGNASLTAAGQFYDFSGSRDPFAGTTGTVVITSLSMFGGLPNLVSAVPGFRPGYFFQSPGGNRQMIYAVGPQTMNAPPGTVIAGVALGGTPTGGGQFDTFLTGSDNLNWIVADFGKFNLPKVEPARLEYMLYRQRVEPETRSLPQPVMRELTQELGRPPTIGEIQEREIAKREAMRMRSGAILERSSFDEDVEEPRQEAKGSAPVIDGGKPQAEAGEQRPEGSGQLSGVRSQLGGGEKPQAKKQTDTKRDPSGPILRNGPRRAVALREEPLDPIQVVWQERERAEVGVAPPLAGK